MTTARSSHLEPMFRWVVFLPSTSLPSACCLAKVCVTVCHDYLDAFHDSRGLVERLEHISDGGIVGGIDQGKKSVRDFDSLWGLQRNSQTGKKSQCCLAQLNNGVRVWRWGDRDDRVLEPRPKFREIEELFAIHRDSPVHGLLHFFQGNDIDGFLSFGCRGEEFVFDGRIARGSGPAVVFLVCSSHSLAEEYGSKTREHSLLAQLVILDRDFLNRWAILALLDLDCFWSSLDRTMLKKELFVTKSIFCASQIATARGTLVSG